MLHYPHVAPRNWELFEAAARRGGVALETWLPHLLQVHCGESGCVPYHGGQRHDPAVILHRTVAPFAGLVVPALGLWSAAGAAVLNDPAAAYLTRDKLATTLALCAAGVPVVETVGFVRPVAASLQGLGAGRIVVKPAHGLRGQGVRVLSGADDPAVRATPD